MLPLPHFSLPPFCFPPPLLQDLTQVDLTSLLPPATIMVITVTATTTPGKPLTQEELEKVMEGCQIILDLDDARRSIVVCMC